jgi:phage terminase large subunit
MGWVKQHWQIQGPTKGGYAPLNSESIVPGGKPSIRMFIPSRVQDNQILLKNQPGYIQLLWDACDGNPELFKAWVEGDWDVFFGQFFSMFDPKIHMVEQPFPIPRHWRLYGSLDYGEASFTAFGLWAVDEDDVSYRIAEYYESGLWVGEHAGRIRDLCENCVWSRGRVPERIWADSAIFHTRSATGHGPANRMVSDVFRDHGLRVVPSNKDRISGWRWLKNCLAWKKDGEGEFLQSPQIFYYPDCANFERTMRDAVFAGTEDAPKEDIDTTTEDHIPDETRYYAMGHYKARNERKDDRPQVMTWNQKMKEQRLARKGRLKKGTSYYITNDPRPLGRPELMFDE